MGREQLCRLLRGGGDLAVPGQRQRQAVALGRLAAVAAACQCGAEVGDGRLWVGVPTLAQVRPGEVIAQVVRALPVTVVLGPAQGVGDAAGGHGVGAQELRGIALLDSARSGEALEEAGHGKGVEAGAGERGDADAIGLLLVVAGEIDPPLDGRGLDPRDGRRPGLGVTCAPRMAAASIRAAVGPDIRCWSSNARIRWRWVTWAISWAMTAASSLSLSVVSTSPA